MIQMHCKVSEEINCWIDYVLKRDTMWQHCFPAACTAMVDEVAWEISQIDPKKTIQVGSFRIDPQGNQKVREVSIWGDISRPTCHLVPGNATLVRIFCK